MAPIVPRKIDVAAARRALRDDIHRRVAARAPKLHAPDDAESGGALPRGGAAPGSAPLLMGVLGESTALGIGCDRPGQILAAQVAQQLADREQREVRWRTAAADGATVRYCLDELVPRLSRGPLDLVVVALGVNDLLRATRRPAFAEQVDHLVASIRAHAPGALVVVSGLPDPTTMPLLPRPLARLLARRARALDAVLADAARRHGLVHVPIRHLPLRPEDLAADRFHPGPAACAAWAGELAAGIPAPLPRRTIQD